MNKIYIGTILLCLAVLAIGPALAAYGDKVTTATTLPIATPLTAFGIPGTPNPAQVIYHIVYDNSGLPAGYRAGKTVYLQFGAPPAFFGNVVKIGDIRLTAGQSGYATGTVVHAGDKDIPNALTPFPGPIFPAAGTTGFYYFDINANGGYDPADPVYLKAAAPAAAAVGINDVRITAYTDTAGHFYPAGSVVVAGNADIASPLILFKAPPVGILSLGLTPPGAGAYAQLAFYNQLGLFGSAGPLYNDGDPVYLDVPPLGTVSPGDIQLA